MAATTTTRAPSSAGLAVGIAGLMACAVLAGVGLAVGEMNAMIIAVALIAAAATFVDFRVGVVLMIILLPLKETTYFPASMFGITGMNPLNLLLAATLASYALRGRFSRFLPKPLAWLFIVPIVAGGLIGLPHVERTYPFFFEMEVVHYIDGFGYLRDVMVKPLLIVLIAMLIGAAVERSHKPERFLTPIVLAVLLMSTIAIGFVVASGVRLGTLAGSGAREFFSALGMHANDLGRLYAVAYGLLLFTWWETEDKALKTVLFVSMGLLVIALALTFSRGAFLGFMVINALFLMWKFNAKSLALGLCGAVAVLALAPGYLIRRVTMGFETGDANTVSAGRIDGIWQPLLPEIFKSPLWGNGLDSTTWADAMWAEQMLTVTHPHSAYLQALLDMGIIGLVLLVAFYIHVWRSMRSLGSNAWLSPTMRGFFQGGLAALACFFVSGLTGSSLRPATEFAFLWIAIGIMYGVLARKPEAAGAPAYDAAAANARHGAS
ncbi:MAG: O-antigen ligase family protein [Betaproteobacteria bacterium]